MELRKKDAVMKQTLIPDERIEQKILLIRKKKVMLDRDLAVLYGVETGNLNKAVKRNIDRFPEDFMFQLTKDEFSNLKFHFGRSSWGGTRRVPYVFTEQGVAMLSSVLRSAKAITVNIQIMRTFVKIRQLVISNEEIKNKLESLEKEQMNQNREIRIIFKTIKELINPPRGSITKIGFRTSENNE